MDRVGIAIVGCGNIAAFYLSTLSRHGILELRGVMDRNASRSAAYATPTRRRSSQWGRFRSAGA